MPVRYPCVLCLLFLVSVVEGGVEGGKDSDLMWALTQAFCSIIKTVISPPFLGAEDGLQETTKMLQI